MLRLGVQVSIAGKIYHAIDRAKDLGCNTVQIFARNPRQYRKSFLCREDISIFREKVKKEEINPVIIHTPYTLNLAAANYGFYKVTIKEFILDLIEADKLGAQYLVTHMGSHKGLTEIRGLRKIAGALGKILKATDNVKTEILLENTSGSGRWLGADFSHLRFILEHLDWPNRLGMCWDTAHAWAAGYKIDDSLGLENVLSQIDKAVEVKRLKVIHLNDTKEKLGSRHDCHAHLDEGNIGKKGFQLILNHPCLRDLPFILETPKKNDEDDVRNLEIAKELRTAENL